ncbi:MAG TPA: FCD domain-containing protein [Solirubrobacteraceae bacterium]|nr:FCD domain-containing protein [Solirubrobacteraceae bacterium]
MSTEDTSFIRQRLRVPRAYEQLAEVLRDRIVSGELREGERLPSELVIARQAGVSRSTVREALRTLQEAGLIERASAKMMVVSGHRDDSAHRELAAVMRRRNVTFAHLHEALLVLDPELTRLATERVDNGDIRALRQNLDAQQRCLDDFAEWSRLDDELHTMIAEMSRNPALIVARTPISKLLLPVLYRFIQSSALTVAALRYHHRILAEIETRDSGLAAEVMRRHVNDFRIAWEKAGLDIDLPIADGSQDPLVVPRARLARSL